jgi:hypothetical protein
MDSNENQNQTDEEILHEINHTLYENELYGTENNPLNSCSVQIPSFQRDVFLLGPYNVLLFRSLNSYVPDLFRVCWFIEGINVPDICPNITTTTETLSFNQKMINPTLIKSFLYFGFSSNILTNYNITVPYPKNNDYYRNLLDIFKNMDSNIIHENYENFDDFTGYFISKYPNYTLLYQISEFIYKINITYNYSISGKSGCNYFIPWEATFLCKGIQLLTINQLKYSLDQSLLINIYQLFYQWLSGTSTLNIDDSAANRLIFFQNFFEVLNYAREVFQDVVIEYSYKTTQKEYCKKEYMSPIYFQRCKELYQIYTQNKIRLGLQSNS